MTRRRRSPPRAATALLIALSLPTAFARVAAADEARCPAPPGGPPGITVVEAGRRLTWIDQRLARTERNSRIWSYGWTATFGAAGVFSLAAVPFVVPPNRVDWYTGAVSAGVGVATLVLAPPAVLTEGPALRRDMAGIGGETDLCSVLAGAQARLIRVARDQQQQGGWYVHVGNLLFNAGLGLFLGLGFHHWGAGAINALAGAAVGEALIFTRPTAAIRDRDEMEGWTP